MPFGFFSSDQIQAGGCSSTWGYSYNPTISRPGSRSEMVETRSGQIRPGVKCLVCSWSSFFATALACLDSSRPRWILDLLLLPASIARDIVSTLQDVCLSHVSTLGPGAHNPDTNTLQD